ncbi:MAG: hypothetical protein J6Y03_06190 [Alphaproteobacteria bacterium]|nr:hypothetical protein [Alphaproteobacteria bacterium]
MNKKFTSIAAAALLVGAGISNKAKADDVSLEEKRERIINLLSVPPAQPSVVVLQPTQTVIKEVTPIVIVKKPVPKPVVIVVEPVLPPPPPPVIIRPVSPIYIKPIEPILPPPPIIIKQGKRPAPPRQGGRHR